MKNQFRYDYANLGSTLACLGDLEWDKEKKQWKATIIPQRDPEIRIEAWDDDGAIAGLICVAKWIGCDLQNAAGMGREEPGPPPSQP